MNHNDLESVSKLLEELMALLDESKRYVFSPRKRIVDAASIYEIVEELYQKIPVELKSARALLSDSENIINEAQMEKERIIKNAQEHADILVSRDEIIKTAQEKAKSIINEATWKASEKNRVTMEFIDGVMFEAEKMVSQSLNELKSARIALKNPRIATNINEKMQK